MHLVINASEVGRQRGGNESYIVGLVGGLQALNPPVKISLLTCDWGRPLDLPPEFQQVNLGPYRRLPFFLWQQTKALRELAADWYLANFFMPLVLPCKGAAVVHDLSFRAHPDYFPPVVAWYMKWLTGRAIRQSKRVLTGSEFSRQEIFRFYHTEPSKVVTTLYAVGPEFRPLSDNASVDAEWKILSRYGVDQPYILALGNIHPRKNLSRLLDAYLLLKSRGASVPQMVWGGLKRWESNDLVTRAQDAGVVLPGFIAQEDLPVFYRQAEMLVYPSLYEGFGLPPVEAMACGTPVITSNTTSLPEVVGDAALRLDPTSVAAIAGAMQELIENTPLRDQLRRAGLERARYFNWKRTAQDVIAALDIA